MENSSNAHKHLREITAGDGVNDEFAILWQERIEDRAKWGMQPSHRAR